MDVNYKFGITKSFPCNYLPQQQERLLVATDPQLHDPEHYAWLMHQGFRRSSNEIYRPHCPQCQACQSLRVLVDEFIPSKSQKRLTRRNQNFSIYISEKPREEYYPLYENYINTLHSDGSMYPATPEQYQSFMANCITNQIYLEIWHNDKLISVAVIDDIPNALSAVYTFYHPDYRKYGLGVFSILEQIKLAKQLKRQFLYLGYQIDDCKKMNYKNRYTPHQILKENQWKTVNK